MNEQETKIVHTHKLDKSVMKVLWVFAIALLLNAVPNNYLISDALSWGHYDKALGDHEARPVHVKIVQ